MVVAGMDALSDPAATMNGGISPFPRQQIDNLRIRATRAVFLSN